ncbi:unnamed protein product [Rhizophagus irregularis]|nr:unnamed protein product [Rhizophagus irregularis]
MVARIYDTYYDAKATLLSEADINEIRESRGKIPNASKKMADKFHIGPKRVYEIWDNKERLQQGVISFFSGQPVLDENSQTNKIEQTEVELSKSTDLASEGSVILGGKMKKTGGKKSKSVQISELFSIQTQPIPASKKDTSNMDALYKKMAKKQKNFR